MTKPRWNDLDWENVDPYDARYYQQIYNAAKERQVIQQFTPGAEIPQGDHSLHNIWWKDVPRAVPRRGDPLNIKMLKRLQDYVYYSAYQYLRPDRPVSIPAPFNKDNRDPFFWDYHADISRPASPIHGTSDPQQIIDFLIYLKAVIQSIRLLSINGAVRTETYSRHKGGYPEEGWWQSSHTTERILGKFMEKPLRLPENSFHLDGISYGGTNDYPNRVYMFLRAHGNERPQLHYNYNYMRFEASDWRWTNGTPYPADVYMDVLTEGTHFNNHGTGLSPGRAFYKTLQPGESTGSVLQDLLGGPVTGLVPPGAIPVWRENYTYGFRAYFFADLGPYFNYKDKANEEPYPPEPDEPEEGNEEEGPEEGSEE